MKAQSSLPDNSVAFFLKITKFTTFHCLPKSIPLFNMGKDQKIIPVYLFQLFNNLQDIFIASTILALIGRHMFRARMRIV